MPVNCVIDVSHHNGEIDFHHAAADGIMAVIIKATEDVKWIDPMMEENLFRARAAGLRVGMYHFATGADPAQQVTHFLNTIAPFAPVVPILDFEQNPTKSMTTMGTTMTVPQAVHFVADAMVALGKPPVLYAGEFAKERLGPEGAGPVLSLCPLWYASYTTQVHIPAGWIEYLMWQYTDGKDGIHPREIPGIGPIDRSFFNVETFESAAAWWDEHVWDGVIRSAVTTGIPEASGDPSAGAASA